jgi:hypothetical protein
MQQGAFGIRDLPYPASIDGRYLSFLNHFSRGVRPTLKRRKHPLKNFTVEQNNPRAHL